MSQNKTETLFSVGKHNVRWMNLASTLRTNNYEQVVGHLLDLYDSCECAAKKNIVGQTDVNAVANLLAMHKDKAVNNSNQETNDVALLSIDIDDENIEMHVPSASKKLQEFINKNPKVPYIEPKQGRKKRKIRDDVDHDKVSSDSDEAVISKKQKLSDPQSRLLDNEVQIQNSVKDTPNATSKNNMSHNITNSNQTTAKVNKNVLPGESVMELTTSLGRKIYLVNGGNSSSCYLALNNPLIPAVSNTVTSPLLTESPTNTPSKTIVAQNLSTNTAQHVQWIDDPHTGKKMLAFAVEPQTIDPIKSGKIGQKHKKPTNNSTKVSVSQTGRKLQLPTKFQEYDTDKSRNVIPSTGGYESDDIEVKEEPVDDEWSEILPITKTCKEMLTLDFLASCKVKIEPVSEDVLNFVKSHGFISLSKWDCKL